MRKVLILCGVVIFLAINASAVSACMCTSIGSPLTERAKVDAIFMGKVVEAKPHEWIFSIDKVWKGNVEKKVLMIDPYAGSSCESRFRLGETYIVFAYVKESNGNVIYKASPCTWTTSLTYRYNGELMSKYILKELNEGKPAVIKFLNKKVDSREGQ